MRVFVLYMAVSPPRWIPRRVGHLRFNSVDADAASNRCAKCGKCSGVRPDDTFYWVSVLIYAELFVTLNIIASTVDK